MKRTNLVIGISALVWVAFLGCDSSPSDSEVGPGPDVGWSNYTTADGMPYDGVGAIAFAPDGGLWCVQVIEGGGGVTHFDGNVWTHYTTENGLASNVILWMETALTVSSDGVLWVATFDAGLCRFDGQKWTTYTKGDGLLSNAVISVALAPNGDVWCAHPPPEGGLSSFDGNTWTIYPESDIGLAGGCILAIAVEPDGVVWVGGGGVGVSHYDGSTWTNYKSELGMEPPVVAAIALGSDSVVWVGGMGVSRYKDDSWTHYSFDVMGVTLEEGNEVMSLAVGPDGALWAGTGMQGVFRYDGTSWVNFTKKDGLVNNMVMSITVGPDGALWFGTGGGISRYLPKDEN